MGYKPRRSGQGGRKSSEETKPSLDIFMILGNILVDKDKTLYNTHVANENFESVFSLYMILRYLSMNANPNVRKIALEHAITLEKMGNRPQLAYKLLMKIVPKTHNRFTPYIKSGFLKKIEKSLS